jgi:hypothetical protein
MTQLIQQAVILQEVMKSDVRKMEPALKNGPNPNAEDEIGRSIHVLSQPNVDTSVMRESLDGLDREKEQKHTNEDSTATTSEQGL